MFAIDLAGSRTAVEHLACWAVYIIMWGLVSLDPFYLSSWHLVSVCQYRSLDVDCASSFRGLVPLRFDLQFRLHEVHVQRALWVVELCASMWLLILASLLGKQFVLRTDPDYRFA